MDRMYIIIMIYTCIVSKKPISWRRPYIDTDKKSDVNSFFLSFTALSNFNKCLADGARILGVLIVSNYNW